MHSLEFHGHKYGGAPIRKSLVQRFMGDKICRSDINPPFLFSLSSSELGQVDGKSGMYHRIREYLNRLFKPRSLLKLLSSLPGIKAARQYKQVEFGAVSQSSLIYLNKWPAAGRGLLTPVLG